MIPHLFRAGARYEEARRTCRRLCSLLLSFSPQPDFQHEAHKATLRALQSPLREFGGWAADRPPLTPCWHEAAEDGGAQEVRLWEKSTRD